MKTTTAIICAVLLVPGNAALFARQAEQSNTEQSVTVPPDQLDALVAPIAVYPDPLLSQTLVASTYPLEIVQLQQWLDSHVNQSVCAKDHQHTRQTRWACLANPGRHVRRAGW